MINKINQKKIKINAGIFASVLNNKNRAE